MKRAVLSIDDGPSVHAAAKAAYLLEKGIPAIWFCRGLTLQERPALADKLVAHDFIIGNHSYDHPHFSARSFDECRRQIERTDYIIEDIYTRHGMIRPDKYFRFPFGDKGGHASVNAYENRRPFSAEGLSKKKDIQLVLRTLGYNRPRFQGITYSYFKKDSEDVDWTWTYDAMEWGLVSEHSPYGIKSAEKVFFRMDEYEPEGGRGLDFPGSEEIVLVHDFAETTNIFYVIIDRLLEKGLEFYLPSDS